MPRDDRSIRDEDARASLFDQLPDEDDEGYDDDRDDSVEEHGISEQDLTPYTDEDEED